MLDPLPRVVLVPGLGLFGLGRSKKDAASLPISPKPRSKPSLMPKRSDDFNRFPKPICSTSNTGRLTSQARKEPERPLAGQIAAITGAAGAIGAATAKAFAAAGAEVALLDRDEDGRARTPQTSVG